MAAKIRVPRWYQEEGCAKFIKDLHEYPDARLLIGMPTGSGKSLVQAMIAKELLRRYPGFRIVMAVDRRELVSQNAQTFLEGWTDAPIGVYAAGLKQWKADTPITFTSIQSAVKNPKAFGRQNFMMIDEVQGVSHGDETNYQKFIKAMLETNKHFRYGGTSATLYRQSGGMLTDQGLFDRVSYDICGQRAFEVLIQRGCLIRLDAHPTTFSYDVSKIRTVGGEFNQAELEREVNDDNKTQIALAEALLDAHDCNHTMVFCTGIDHVESTSAILNSWGYKSTYVHSKMSDTERDYRINQFRMGDVDFICNDGILTTGFDSAWVDHIIILRPTKSIVRHVQILGRGTRPYFLNGHRYDLDTDEGRLECIAASPKHWCKVSDFGRNLERLGPINDPRIPGKKKSGDMPIKICTTARLVYGTDKGGALIGCGHYNFCAARRCEKCGADFIFDDQPKITDKASTAVATVFTEPELHWFPVTRIEYEPYTKAFTPTCMRVHYYCGLSRYTEWVAIESTAPYARHKAKEWWRDRDQEPPAFTNDGFDLVDDLPVPTHVQVQTNLKFPRIMNVSFDGIPEQVELATPSYLKESTNA